MLIKLTNTLADEINNNLTKIKILPLGNVTTTKGNFVVDDTSVDLIIRTFKKRGLDIVIDYEHQSVSDDMAIASGWIKELLVEDDCLVGLAEWTEQAKEQIKNKQYKYLSPTVLLKNNRAVRLHSVALTNTPAIDNMYPLFLSDKANGDNKMDIKKILEFLELDESATTEDVLNKIAELKNNNKEDEDDDTELSANKDKLEVLALKQELKQLKEETELKDINFILDTALEEGKMIPAQREGFKKLALADREAFNTVMRHQPNNVSPISTTYCDNLTEHGKNIPIKCLEDVDEFIKNNIQISNRSEKEYYEKYLKKQYQI